MKFDTLITGGHVIDSASGINGRKDIAIQRNRIAAVEDAIPPEAAFHLIDARGQYVTPGLIDLHTHIYRGGTYWGIDADTIAARTGVTTWLDVGSAGALNLLGFREFIAKPSAVRIYALLNISTIGLTGKNFELAVLDLCDVALCEKMVNLHRDLVLGIKVRMGTPTIGTNGLEPLRRAREAAEACAMPMMVHIATAPPDVNDVLALMRPGDILTHCYTGQTMRLLDEQGRVRDLAKQAWDRGIIMDIGHGSGSFSFATAETLLAAGLAPNVISSDIHQESILGPMFDLPTVLSKFLHLGMSLPDVIAAATARPAAVLGLANEIGTLRPGAYADIAVFTLEQGQFPFYDIFGAVREGRHLLRNALTIANGRVLERREPHTIAPWIAPTEFQRELWRRGHVPDQMADTAKA